MVKYSDQRKYRAVTNIGATAKNYHDMYAHRKTKAKLKILLLCMGYNINKLHAKIQKERISVIFFQ